MVMLARAANPQPWLDLPERTFASLSEPERARLGVVLRPLAWIDGLIAAAVIAPEEPEEWIEHVWNEDELGKLTLVQSNDVASVVVDHFCHVAEVLFENPEAYRPFLGDAGAQLQAAAQWAAGFCFGIGLQPESWAPLIDDDSARLLLAAIFILERDEDLPEEARADPPFRDIAADRRKEVRRMAAGALPDLVRALHSLSISLDDGEFGEEPYVRAAPKIGRNDPCPCGSGKKYKKCCLGHAAYDE